VPVAARRHRLAAVRNQEGRQAVDRLDNPRRGQSAARRQAHILVRLEKRRLPRYGQSEIKEFRGEKWQPTA
jgi:hypothetical protein